MARPVMYLLLAGAALIVLGLALAIGTTIAGMAMAERTVTSAGAATHPESLVPGVAFALVGTAAGLVVGTVGAVLLVTALILRLRRKPSA